MPVGHRQSVATNVQRGPDALLDTFGLAIGCVFYVLLAAPVMKDGFSRGYRDTSSAFPGAAPQAPRSLATLHLYPRSDSSTARASFLVQYFPRIPPILLDLCGPDTWLAAVVSLWLLRVASRICLPHRMYTRLAAPILTFAARGAPLAFLLAAGPSAPLSTAASAFLFRCQGYLDVVMSLTQPLTWASAEVAFNVVSLAAVGLLATWHGQSRIAQLAGVNVADAVTDDGGASDVPSGRVFVVKVVLQRAALVIAVHLLAWRFIRRRRTRSGGGGTAAAAITAPNTSRPLPTEAEPAVAAAPATPAAVAARVTASAPMPPASSKQPSAGKRGCEVGRSPQRNGENGHPPQAAEFAGGKCGHCSGGTCQMRGMPCQAAATEAAVAAAALAAAAEGEDPAAVLAKLVASLPAVAAAAAGAANTSAGLGVYDALRMSPGIPYKSPIRRRTIRVKVPFAEPEQITPGYVQRMEALAAERGMHLSGVYVRRGCIELLMDLEAEALDGVAQNAGTASFKAQTDPRVSETILDYSDVEAILRALGVDPAVAEQSAAPADMVDVASLQLGGGAVLGPKSADAPLSPRVLEISPRVLPQKLPAGAATAKLAVVVSYPEFDKTADMPGGEGVATAAANTAAQQQPPLPEVLVRSQGVYLPCRVALRSIGGAGTTGCTVTYDVELVGLPALPGTLLVEFRWGGGLSPATPVLVVDDEAVAAELLSGVERMQATLGGGDGGSAAAAGTSDGEAAERANTLDDLLMDLGSWLAVSAAPQLASRFLPYSIEGLMEHMLGHAVACGWTATSDRLRTDLARAAGDGGNGGVDITSGVPEAVAAPAAVASDAAAKNGAAAGGPESAPEDTFGRLRRGGPGPLLTTAFRHAVGWSVLPPKEEAAYQAYAAPRVLRYSHVIQAMEFLSLLALLFRARQQLLDPGNLTTLCGCAVGTLTLAAWPVLKRRQWERLVDAVKVPRYIFYMTAKLMIGWLGFPAPPGIVPYQLGAAMVIMEGVLLPFSCLMSPRAALVLALVKLPFGMGMMIKSEVTDSIVRALVLNIRVVLAAVATTVACHTYLRYSYALHDTACHAACGVPAPAAPCAAGTSASSDSVKKSKSD